MDPHPIEPERTNERTNERDPFFADLVRRGATARIAELDRLIADATAERLRLLEHLESEHGPDHRRLD